MGCDKTEIVIKEQHTRAEERNGLRFLDLWLIVHLKTIPPHTPHSF